MVGSFSFRRGPIAPLRIRVPPEPRGEGIRGLDDVLVVEKAHVLVLVLVLVLFALCMVLFRV